MRLNDLEPLVKVFLHGFVIDQVLFELFSQFGTEHFKVLSLLSCFLIDLDDLFVDVSAQEVGSLGRVLLSFFNFSEDFANVAVLTFFNLRDLCHNILQQILHEHLSFLVAIHALVNLNADHLRHLIRYLHLIVLETINFIPDRIVDFGDFSA